jgi:uncharacterized membrane protein (UPF0127 family)
MTVRNQTRDTEIACAEWRGSMLGRARGLLGRSHLPAGDGIVISPCNSVHMFFMRFPLDVVYIDKEHRVVKTATNLKPWRVSFGGKGAHAAIELPVGAIAASKTAAGDELHLVED